MWVISNHEVVEDMAKNLNFFNSDFLPFDSEVAAQSIHSEV